MATSTDGNGVDSFEQDQPRRSRRHSGPVQYRGPDRRTRPNLSLPYRPIVPSTRYFIVGQCFCSVDLPPMVMGIGDPMSSKTRRCSGVGTESCSIWMPWVNSTVFLVRVPRWASRVEKLWSTSPSAPSLVASLAWAARDRSAGATGSWRSGISSSLNMSGARASLMCQVTYVNGHAIMHRCGQIIARWRTPKLHAHLGPGSRWTTRTSLRRNSESIGFANGIPRARLSTHHVVQCTTLRIGVSPCPVSMRATKSTRVWSQIPVASR